MTNVTTNLPSFEGISDLISETGLKGQEGREYIADKGLVHAANTALCLEMPLLLTGDPGCGKSDFAWVAARALGHEKPLRCFIRSDTKARDLLYHYDALVHFSDAQLGGKRDRVEDPRNYISLRPLGAALMDKGPKRAVVLLDEIDKAPRDLPNDLLRELDEMHFEIPEIGDVDTSTERFDRTFKNIALHRDMKRPPGVQKPLVIVTSNAERQLPDPFLRRCVFYHIPRPNEHRLAEIAEAWFGKGQRSLIDKLATVFYALRNVAGLHKPPTTVEMLKWVQAMTTYHAREVAGTIEAFANKLAKKEDVNWAMLPGLPLLVKLSEDLETLGIDADAR